MVGLIIIIVIASILVASKYKLDEEKDEDDKTTENCDQRQSIQYSKVEKQVLNLLRKDGEQKWRDVHCNVSCVLCLLSELKGR